MMNWKNSIFVLTLSLVIFLFIYGCSKQSSNPITPPTNPVISSLSKIHGLPGSSMDINGSGFGSEQGTSYVDFNGTKASATDISSWSDTKITTKIPALATTGKLSVFANNTKSNELDFTVDTIVPGGPQIDNISPTNFAVGDIVTINGSNFGSMQLAGYVMFINKQPPNVSDYTEWTNTQIKVKVPAVTSSGTLYVFQNNAKSNAVDFTLAGVPTITNINPDSAQSGQMITISGSNFGNTRIPLTSYVDFGGFQPADSQYVSWSNAQIKVIVPANVFSPCSLKVCVAGNKSNALTLKIIIPIPAPVIYTISPNPAQHGQAITITGKHFGSSQGSNYVTISGITPAQTDYTGWSDTQIIVNIPDNASSGAVIAFVNGQSSNAFTITIQAPPDNTPKIDYVAPTSAQVGQSVAINGSNFGATQGTGYVTFNGTQAASSDYTQWSATKIVVKVPTGATTGNIIVNANNKSSNGVTFTVQAQNYIVDCVEINPGSFIMGCDTRVNNYPEEAPAHTVNISYGFYMSKYEVTQAQWKTVLNGSDPSKWKSDNNPVEQITWLRCIDFCNTLSTMTGLKPCYTVNGTDVTCDFTANGFRLPTEAEWEYACRAGTTGDYAGASYNDIAWVNTNSNDIDHNVGLKTANAWGLFDMEGNVWEWCWDWYDPDYYASLASTVTDPRGPATSKAGALRAFRGGSYDAAPIDVRCSRRDGAAPDDLQMNRGFRVVRNK